MKLVTIQDPREQSPWLLNKPVEVGKLDQDDYSLRGFERHFAIEHENLLDLLRSIIKGGERFFLECERRAYYQFAGLITESPEDAIQLGTYPGFVRSESVFSSPEALRVRYRLHIIFADDGLDATGRFGSLACMFVWQIEKDATALDLSGKAVPKKEEEDNYDSE